MKKNIWLAAGVAAMLLGAPSANAGAEVNIRLGGGRPPSFVLDTRPNFVALPGFGFSVSVGSPYDIVYYGNRYYLFQDGMWYRSSQYRGPWVVVRDGNLPYNIRRHRWEDIRSRRDIEYRRHDNRNNRNQRFNDNRDERGQFRDNRPNGRNDDNRQFNPNVPVQPNPPAQPNNPRPGQPNNPYDRNNDNPRNR